MSNADIASVIVGVIAASLYQIDAFFRLKYTARYLFLHFIIYPILINSFTQVVVYETIIHSSIK